MSVVFLVFRKAPKNIRSRMLSGVSIAPNWFISGIISCINCSRRPYKHLTWDYTRQLKINVREPIFIDYYIEKYSPSLSWIHSEIRIYRFVALNRGTQSPSVKVCVQTIAVHMVYRLHTSQFKQTPATGGRPALRRA